MRTTVDPNQLAPLTELANKALQEGIRGFGEFSTSSRWLASAIVLQMREGPEGYELKIGFELRTPLEESLQDTITDRATLKEVAARHIVNEWIAHYLKPAIVIHAAGASQAGKLGETLVAEKGRAYPWRMVEGTVLVATDDKVASAELQRDLGESSLMQRLNLAQVLPVQRELPLLCVKLQIARPSVVDAGGGAPVAAYDCRVNDEVWAKGLEILQRFQLPPCPSALRVVQYLFIRREGKPRAVTEGAGATGGTGGGSTKAGAGAGPSKGAPAVAASSPPRAAAGKRPWWKLW